MRITRDHVLHARCLKSHRERGVEIRNSAIENRGAELQPPVLGRRLEAARLETPGAELPAAIVFAFPDAELNRSALLGTGRMKPREGITPIVAATVEDVIDRTEKIEGARRGAIDVDGVIGLLPRMDLLVEVVAVHIEIVEAIDENRRRHSGHG